MFGRSGFARVISANVAEIERRMRSLEKQLHRAGSRSPAMVVQATDNFGEAVASALSTMADRFRGNARSVGDETAKFVRHTAKFSNDALRRVSKEVAHRPLVTLAVAVGVGLLVGLISRR